ncbi:MAG TPA: bacteriohopanetetrol glucosamine biosynthesis glycosyltransferase HpnI [Candidatus Sulfotelmatobacter sp.]|jgi:ceramide glucosyltransferase
MMHDIVRIFHSATIIVACVGCLSSSIYYLICLRSARAFLRRQEADGIVRPTKALPPVSILKPLKGSDPDIYESFRSHCLQNYPEYEIIFGVSDSDDPAVASVRQLQREFPSHTIRLVVSANKLGPNVKVSNLEQMLPAAHFEHLIVNDSDIRVEPDYLRRIVAPLADERVGMVTCLYVGVAANTLGSQLEALGISTDFCPGVLVARQLEGGLRFGLGSTLAFRRSDLAQIGGFRAIVDFLADDYEIGRRIADLGLQVQLSDVVVETRLPAYDLRGFWAHQLRWARGVRDARKGGYIGLISTYGLMWALLALIAAGAAAWSWAILGVMLLLRSIVALVIGRSVLRDARLTKNLWLLPIRDFIAVAVWVASFAGHTVTWRGDRFELKQGRLTRIPS